MSFLIILLLFLAAFIVGTATGQLAGFNAILKNVYTPWQTIILRGLFGAGLLGLVALVGNVLWILPQNVASGIIFVLGIAGLLMLGREMGVWSWSRPPLPDIFWGIVFIAASLLLIRYTWFPHLNVDTHMYHFTTPKQWLVEGGFRIVPWEVHANFYQLWPAWLFWGIAIAPDDFVIPRLQQVLLLIIAGSFLFCEVRRRTPCSAVAWFGALLWLLSLDSMEFATTDYMDHSMGFVFLCAVTLAARAMEQDSAADRRRLYILSGIFLGFAIGMKITALLLTVVTGFVAGCVMTGVFMRRGNPFGKALGLAFIDVLPIAVASFLVMLPWAVKNAVITGNPLYPFFPKFFTPGIDFIHQGQAFLDFYAVEKISMMEWLTKKLLAIAGYFRNFWYLDQNKWTSFLLLSLMFWLRGVAAGCAISGATASRVFQFSVAAALVPLVVYTPARRFVMGPSLLFALLTIEYCAALWASDSIKKPLVRKALVGAALVVIAFLFHRADHYLSKVHIDSSMRRPGWYLTPAQVRGAQRQMPLFETVEFLEANLTKDHRVLVTGNLMLLSMADVPLLSNPHIHSENAIRIMLNKDGNSPAEVVARLREHGVTHLLTDDLLGDDDAAKLRDQFLSIQWQEGGWTLHTINYPSTNP